MKVYIAYWCIFLYTSCFTVLVKGLEYHCLYIKSNSVLASLSNLLKPPPSLDPCDWLISSNWPSINLEANCSQKLIKTIPHFWPWLYDCSSVLQVPLQRAETPKRHMAACCQYQSWSRPNMYDCSSVLPVPLQRAETHGSLLSIPVLITSQYVSCYWE